MVMMTMEMVMDVMKGRLRGWLKCECDFLLLSGTIHLIPYPFYFEPPFDLLLFPSLLISYPLSLLDTFVECTFF